MKQELMGDYPHIKGLDKQEPLKTNPAKRTGKLKSVRHKVKEYLRDILKFNK